MSKDYILEIYLNHIYFGRGAYVALSAAKAYFSKDLQELTLREIAILASLPKAPSAFNPETRKERLKNRSNWVLKQMFMNGYIDAKELSKATEEPPVFTQKFKFSAQNAGNFSTEIKHFLATKYGMDSVFRDGFIVQATLNAKFQNALTSAIRSGIEEYDQRHGFRGPVGHIKADVEEEKLCNKLKESEKLSDFAKSLGFVSGVYIQTKNKLAKFALSDCSYLEIGDESVKFLRHSISKTLKPGDLVNFKKNADKYEFSQVPEVNGAGIIMEHNSGKILAMVGDYFDEDNGFNRATKALRQPGSAFKPFVYLAALEENYAPTFQIADEDISLSAGNGESWTPRNDDNKNHGIVSLRYALTKSLNVPTVRLSDMIGLSKIAELIKRLGVVSNPNKDLSLVLGSQEVRLIDMVKGYGQIANGGHKIEPYLVEYVQDKNNNLIYSKHLENITKCENKKMDCADLKEEVINPQTAYQINSILQGALQHGTSFGLRGTVNKIGLEAGAKTGTTNDSKDSWLMMFTPEYVIGVYVGFDQPKTLGRNEYGATVALPIVRSLIPNLEYHKRRFDVPNGLQTLKVDLKTGLLSKNSNDPHTVTEFFTEKNKLPESSKNLTEDFSLGVDVFD
jgi:penicillin-binding protein 1A